MSGLDDDDLTWVRRIEASPPAPVIEARPEDTCLVLLERAVDWVDAWEGPVMTGWREWAAAARAALAREKEAES